LNVAFWYALLALLVRGLRPATLRDWLCVGAIVFTSGALHSLARSLVDLPATTFCVLAAFVGTRSRVAALAAAALTKDVYAICAWTPLPGGGSSKERWWKIPAAALLTVLPLALWTLYVRSRLGSGPLASGNLAWPFYGWLRCIVVSFGGRHTHDSVAALSLLAQFVYLASRPRPQSFLWRIGITFGVAGAFLGPPPFVNQLSFTRDLLPMTIAFNAALLEENLRSFPRWFAVGNVGLGIGFGALVVKIFWNV
jgi:hypothetical protein